MNDGLPVVLQVLPALEAGGVERTAVDVAAALRAAGVASFVASAGGRLVREVERAGATHVTLPLQAKNPISLRLNSGRLAALVERQGIGLIHARSRAPAWSARAAALRSRVPFVTTFAGTYGEDLPGKKIYNGIMASGDRVIANSHFIAQHIADRYPQARPRLVTIPRGIDFNLFDPARVGAERVVHLARQWRLPDGVPVVMLPGRLTRWKGQKVLIEAAGLVKTKEFLCVILGDDQGRDGYRKELENDIRRRGLTSKVCVLDHCRDMAAAYMLADVVVSASIEPEAFGRIPVEAQAMGRPVIATDHGGAAETVRHGETGWLIPPGDPVAMAAAIDAALGLDAATRADLAPYARAHAAATWSLDKMTAATLELYRELAASWGRAV